ncbi:hypothetical protein [Legionella sainthelensi]|uniref:Uncharacterized protein n=1 Tax=Legionella sainthelensi TaxID=28087 RepID=A0A2H5FM36_9GAMM|nr:hypothetical protein [Legionella sainthelensi]AUH72616.1 hypothetical protein CAB17_11550 [Legionella sainthelensi]
MAIQCNKPSDWVIHSSERRSQHWSNIYQTLLKEDGFIFCISGSDNCYENAGMESFYHIFKIEVINN